MADRGTEPLRVEIEVAFRSATSFLVAYSVHLSRGVMFLETEYALPIGGQVMLQLAVPDATTRILVTGVVAWRRDRESDDGRPGISLELERIAGLDTIVDRLVAARRRVHVALVAADRQDRATLARMVRSVISTAEVVHGDPRTAARLLTGRVDLALVDVDGDPEAGLAVLRQIKGMMPTLPVVALASTRRQREHARATRADEVTSSNPPGLSELQRLVIRALGRPLAIRHVSSEHTRSRS